jgi:excisionase family DNA binding protein
MSTDKVTEHDDHLLWTISDIAEQLAVDRKTISRLIAKGELPVVQIGRCKRVPKQAVLDWVEGQTRYNLGCVESVLSQTGDSLCDSINVTAFTKLPTNQQVENRLDALLKPVKSE